MTEPRLRLLDHDLFYSLASQAGQSARRRAHFPLHSGPGADCLLNAFLLGAYFRPHRHVDPPKSETLLALSGAFAVFAFDDAGNVTDCHVLGRDAAGVHIQPGVWHSIAVLTAQAVCFEAKSSPFTPATDKQFAPWAPHEDHPSAAEYLQRLLLQNADRLRSH